MINLSPTPAFPFRPVAIRSCSYSHWSQSAEGFRRISVCSYECSTHSSGVYELYLYIKLQGGGTGQRKKSSGNKWPTIWFNVPQKWVKELKSQLLWFFRFCVFHVFILFFCFEADLFLLYRKPSLGITRL